eukprot:CAMPEP_0168526646 /NCGR_PEP_ID=MMETSP0405-20121227/12105_1 /TAXON_ID=498012 /ORGANISM="Trichosphaerium sp, Strain Am-I-7 wt" /LENGTH=153 /DNA_ID=CAMNT_0008549555 /DNA_START=30 /DNA_END=491 /DNA_ORIENTATION=+
MSDMQDCSPEQCSHAAKVGRYVMMGGKDDTEFPCKVTSTQSSRPGKHGHAKLNFMGVDIFSGKKYNRICPAHQNIMVPEVKRTEYPLIDMEKGVSVTMLDENGETYVLDYSAFPSEDKADELFALFTTDIPLVATVLSAVGQEQICEWREDKS